MTRFFTVALLPLLAAMAPPSAPQHLPTRRQWRLRAVRHARQDAAALVRVYQLGGKVELPDRAYLRRGPGRRGVPSLLVLPANSSVSSRLHARKDQA